MIEAEAQRLEQRVAAEAQRFDVPALLDALSLLGYDDGTIRFRSHPTLLHSGALIQAVELQRTPRQAVVFLNIGLMSSQGPLPMYFWELLIDQRDASMTEFLWFFDQSLLADRIAAQHPERDSQVFTDWPTTRRLMLLLLRLPSPSGVHWLTAALFPELEVEVRRVTGTRRLRTPEILVGGTELGTGSTLGGVTDLPVGGVEVLLICDPEDPRDAAAWIDEAQRRLTRLVLPILFEQDPYMYLRAYLVLRRRPDHVRLARDRYMGVNRLFSSGKNDLPYEQLLLWAGEVRQAIATEQMNFSLPSGHRGTASRKE